MTTEDMLGPAIVSAGLTSTEDMVADRVLLRDLVAIPDEVHAGDFVLGLAQGITEKPTITDYVVTDLLAQDFDRALGVIK
jgi:hypothetical protein